MNGKVFTVLILALLLLAVGLYVTQFSGQYATEEVGTPAPAALETEDSENDAGESADADTPAASVPAAGVSGDAAVDQALSGFLEEADASAEAAAGVDEASAVVDLTGSLGENDTLYEE